MERKDEFAPMEFVKDGKLTRRTFVKGAGWITVASALGFGAAGCAPQKEAPAPEPDAQPGDPDEGYTYKSACCTVNCTSRCHLRARVKDDRHLRHRARPDAWPRRLRERLPARHGAGAAHARRGRARHVPHEAHGRARRRRVRAHQLGPGHRRDSRPHGGDEGEARRAGLRLLFVHRQPGQAVLGGAHALRRAPTAPPRSTSRASWATTARPWA